MRKARKGIFLHRKIDRTILAVFLARERFRFYFSSQILSRATNGIGQIFTRPFLQFCLIFHIVTTPPRRWANNPFDSTTAREIRILPSGYKRYRPNVPERPTTRTFPFFSPPYSPRSPGHIQTFTVAFRKCTERVYDPVRWLLSCLFRAWVQVRPSVRLD